MVGLGTDAGVRTVALLTDMDTPLGLTAGNALEVRESVEVLAGGGPADVVELTLRLAREMLAAAGVTASTRPTGWRDGSAMDVWRRMIAAQGGDPDAPLPAARETHVVHRAGGRRADPAGRVRRSASPPGGSAPAGPARRTRCSAGAGVVMHAKPGDAGARRRAAADAAHRRARAVRAGAGGARGRLRGRRRPAAAAAGHRPDGAARPASPRRADPSSRQVDEYAAGHHRRRCRGAGRAGGGRARRPDCRSWCRPDGRRPA